MRARPSEEAIRLRFCKQGGPLFLNGPVIGDPTRRTLPYYDDRNNSELLRCSVFTPNLLRPGPFFERKNVCDSEENGVRGKWCLHKVHRDSKSQGDSKFTTCSKFITRSIFSTAESFGQFEIGRRGSPRFVPISPIPSDLFFWGSPKASHIKASQPHFLHFPRFRVRIFRIFHFLLRGVSSDPCFCRVRGAFRIFRIFAVSGSNR